MTWSVWIEGKDPELDKIVTRRFGRGYEKPCADPDTILCTMPECQFANHCRKSPIPSQTA